LEWICLGNQPFNLPPVSWLTLLRFLCRVRRRITAAGKCDGRSKQWVTWLLTMFFYTCGWMYSFFFTEDGCIRLGARKRTKNTCVFVPSTCGSKCICISHITRNATEKRIGITWLFGGKVMVTLTQSVPSDASLAPYYATYQSLYLF
jgi:hypothetical protein